MLQWTFVLGKVLNRATVQGCTNAKSAAYNYRHKIHGNTSYTQSDSSLQDAAEHSDTELSLSS